MTLTKKDWNMLFEINLKLMKLLVRYECDQYHCGHPVCNARRKKEAGK
jgi:hypothetical protein